MVWWNPKTWFTAPRRTDDRDLPSHARTSSATPAASETAPASLRRFFVGQATDRLNAAHWKNAHGESINNDLAEFLPSLMARCALEYSLNSDFQGVVDTYCQDVVGPTGPRLQIQSESEEFNEIVEQNWKRIFAKPRPRKPHISGAQNMQQWVRMLCLTGSYVNLLKEYQRPDAVNFGWQSIHPRRMVTPANMISDPNVAFGIEFDDEGDPVAYNFDRPTQFGPYSNAGMNPQRLPADMVQHRFLEVEPEQMTGFPWMTQGLESAGQLFDYDKAEMEAAKLHAMISVGLENADPTAVVDPVKINSSTLCYEPGMANVAPKGWRWSNHQATQPNPNSIAFRHEKLAGVGRGLHMPLLIIMLRVDQASFSSAQFAGELYKQAIANTQGYIDQTTLDELVSLVVLELALGGLEVPSAWQTAWTHNVPPHANVEKFVSSLVKLVENGIIAPSHASSAMGFQFEDEVVPQRARDNELLDQAGLPPAPVSSNTPDDEPGEGNEGESSSETSQQGVPANA